MSQNNQQSCNIKWPELIFYAEANNEPFKDIRIVTAQTKYVSIANDIFANTISSGARISNRWEYNARAIINMQKHSVHEYVKVDKGEIEVCINVPVLDEDATSQALDMVTITLNQLDGMDGVVYFSDKLTFTTADIPWLV